MKLWKTDEELFGLARRELFTCVVGGVEEEAFRRALEKARGEKKVESAMENGLSACAAFEQYGIM
jgi:hypothetical protein